jgi:hypothetical protein
MYGFFFGMQPGILGIKLENGQYCPLNLRKVRTRCASVGMSQRWWDLYAQSPPGELCEDGVALKIGLLLQLDKRLQPFTSACITVDKKPIKT